MSDTLDLSSVHHLFKMPDSVIPVVHINPIMAGNMHPTICGSLVRRSEIQINGSRVAVDLRRVHCLQEAVQVAGREGRADRRRVLWVCRRIPRCPPA